MSTLHTQFSSASRAARAIIATNVLGLVLLAVMVGVRASTPSDGARAAPNGSVWQADGGILSPWRPDSPVHGPIHEGDKVLAVNGVPLATIVRDGVTSQSALSPYQSGHTLSYTVVRENQVIELQVPLQPFDFGAWLGEAWIVLVSCVVAQGVGTFVFLGRPNEQAARAVLLWTPGLWTSGALYSFGFHISDFYSPLAFWLYQLSTNAGYVLIFVSIVRFALEYTRPAGRVFNALRREGAVWLTYLVPYVFVAGYLVVTWLNTLRSATASPILWLNQWRFSTTLVGLLSILLSVGITLISYRSTKNAATRLKIRWVVFTGCTVALLNLPLNILPSLLQGGPASSLNLIVPLFVLFDIAIAFSILRYRYMDIDVLIRRTVVYSAMAVVLGAAYTLALVLIGSLVLSTENIGVVLGLGAANPRASVSADVQLAADIAIVLTTLLGVFSFDKLRRKLQIQVDRVFFRRRYNTEQAIAELGAVLRREVDYDKLNGQLLTLVQDSVQPQHVSLWTRPAQFSRAYLSDEFQ